MTRRIVFVTHELEPVTPGGAGAVVTGLATRLAATGWEVVVVLATPDAVTTTALPGVTLVPVAAASDGTLASFLDRSHRVADAVAGVVASGSQPHLIEFHDFDLPAWWALTHRHELGLEATPIAIRLHGPVDAMVAAMGAAPPVLAQMAELERMLFAMADVVIAPSDAMRSWARERYALDGERIVVAPPPIPQVATVPRTPSPSPEFVAYGRLNEVKGSHDLVAAALRLFERHPQARVRFIGGDGWSASEDRPMSEMLGGRIPSEWRDRISFEGALGRDAALAAMATAWAVIVPSRFESFCISLHEVRRAGFPVIAAALPAFAGFAGGAGVRLYDGGVPGLAAALLQAAGDPGGLDLLAREPAPAVGDPLAAYSGALPAVRHPRSQAGLATAAVKHAETLAEVAPTGAASLARRVLRVLPRPLARIAVRMVPRPLKERFRRFASWPEEVARREREQHLADLRGRVRRGEFPPLEAPRVSIVIPCFEQGRWLEDAVASVFAQIFDSWEIVLVDDGSTDPATIRLLDRIGRWPRVQLVRQGNEGLPAARNTGIARSSGEYVVPLDADDELDPRYLEVLVAALAERPDAAYAHCWARLFGDIDAIWVPRPFNRYWQRLSNGIVGCVLLRRSAWEAVGGYDATMRRGHEDWELWVRLDAAGWEQVRVNQPLFCYRKRGVSMSVASEASFEAGLLEIRERHPALYDSEALRTVKQQCYPFLSVILDAGATAEPIPSDVTLAASPLGATGKYVTDGRHPSLSLDAALAAAERLEAAPGAAAAVDGENVVWRRWALADPGADVAGTPDGAVVPPGALAAGALADPDWMVDPAQVPGGWRVMRQRPEEPGHLPDWVGP
jgi:glycosyltransferase involved in cell wall biosynthesis